MYDVDIGRKLQNVEINIFMALLHINMQSYAIKNGYICLLLAGSLMSGCVTWCPASPRAALSHSDNQSSWAYRKNWFDLREGDIRVTCDTHQH